GKETDAGRQDETVNEYDKRRALEILELGRLDFTVNLRQCLFAAHCENGMSKCNEETENANSTKEPECLKIAEESEGVLNLVDVPAGYKSDFFDRFVFFENGIAVFIHLWIQAIEPRRIAHPHLVFPLHEAIGIRRLAGGDFVAFHLDVEIGKERHALRRTFKCQRQAAPPDDERRHDRGGNHDFQGLIAGFVDAQQILTKEVQGYADCQYHSTPAENDFADFTGISLIQM